MLRKVDVIKLKQVEHVRNERNVLAAVAGHPFITRLIASFSDETSLYMLLDYTPGGEIFSYLRRARRFPLATVQFYAAEITLILSYLHDVQHVAYRDLKPENILLTDKNLSVKLADFGLAKIIGEESFTTTLCGTPSCKSFPSTSELIILFLVKFSLTPIRCRPRNPGKHQAPQIHARS